MNRNASKQGKSRRRSLLLLLLILCLCPTVLCERLPLKPYTTADGLPNNVINRIVRDSRGFLWFCTMDGLSRFDGYTFTNYGTDQGLPHPTVNDLLETSTGEYWLATNGGLVRFNPKGLPLSTVVSANDPDAATRKPMFMVVRPDDDERLSRFVTRLREDRSGIIWCGTYNGLYRIETKSGHVSLIPVDLGMPNDYPEQRYVNAVAEDRYGTLWVATPNGLYRRWPDGKTAHYGTHEGLPDIFLHDLLLDHQGRLWIGSRNAGFFRLAIDGTHALPSVAFVLAPHDFNQSEWINQLFETSDNKLWAGTARGLLEYLPDGDDQGKHYRLYTPQNGLSEHAITALAEDSGGSLWLGGGTGAGAMRLARHGFVTYDQLDGVAAVYSIFADRAGGVCFRGEVVGDKQAPIFEGGKVDLLNQNQATYWPRYGRFDRRQLSWFVPDALKGRNLGWVGEHVTLQSRSGEWWLAMGAEEGLYRFAATDNFTQLKKARPLEVFGKESILRGRQIWRLFEDSHQRIWVATIDSTGNGLALWERESGKLRDLTGAQNLPSLKTDLVRSLGEDRAGDIWIGFNTGIARLRGDSFVFFTTKDGLPQGAILDSYTDHAGRLWLASSRGGLVRVDDPSGDKPVFFTYTSVNGLSSNSIDVITEDLNGRIYAGGGRGVDELDPSTGRVKHFTTADGLASGAFLSALRDGSGTLWFGMHGGLSHFVPGREERTSPPPIIITGLRTAGSMQTVSALGEKEMILNDLPANQNELQINFVGLSFAPGDILRYQYKLGEADWSPPTEQRVVNLANLAAGRYRFMVRAINSEGIVSSEPATVAFRILPPFWLRWWFITLSFIAVGGAAYGLYRYRVARLLEVANMRTRIATDLHDDIGANLTRISILSEVVKQQFANVEDSKSPLTSIADIARESVASMSDIVWAIDPERDSLRDLTRKMRQHADEIFTLRDIDLEFNTPGREQDLRLGVDIRRDLLLIFKEAVSNAARHSNCSRVVIDFSADNHQLSLRVADDGSGFDLSSENAGHGLVSMRRRAEKLHGSFNVETLSEKGTTVSVGVPLFRVRRA